MEIEESETAATIYGDEVAPPLDCSYAKRVNGQIESRGGYLLIRSASKCGRSAKMSPSQFRGNGHTIRSSMKQEVYSYGNGQVNAALSLDREVSKTLDCMHEPAGGGIRD